MSVNHLSMFISLCVWEFWIWYFGKGAVASFINWRKEKKEE